MTDIIRNICIGLLLSCIVSIPCFLFMFWTILSDIADHVECMHSHMAEEESEYDD